MWTCVLALQCWVFLKGGYSPPLPCSANPDVAPITGESRRRAVCRPDAHCLSELCHMAGHSRTCHGVGFLPTHSLLLESQQKPSPPACNWAADTIQVNIRQSLRQVCPPTVCHLNKPSASQAKYVDKTLATGKRKMDT